MKQKLSCLLVLSFFISGLSAQYTKLLTDPDPLSIPLATRQAYYSKGNLIQNASFEQELAHWTIVGKNVVLTDIRTGAKETGDTHDGVHAVKITRTKTAVNEIDGRSEGVISDFIEVIPGNYNFDFDIRLKNIMPAVERFQSRIGKGIDIHLEFFDGDKKAISPGYYFDYLGKEVDNSFKGFAFTNFFYLDEFKWGRVKGRSWNYPFSEGDLPANCKYVRIFAGLNCSGTMWIDNLDFHLSKWDFKPADRVDSFFTRTYRPSQLLIPMPRLVQNEHPIPLGKGKIGIVNNGPASPETEVALALLKQRFRTTDKAGSKELQIVFLSFADRDKSEWQAAFQAIAGKGQGYFIRRKGNVLYIGANKGQGLYYGVTTLCQLIDKKTDVLDYVDVTDYPDFTGRSTVLMGYENEWQMDQNKSLTDSAKKARVADRDKNLRKQVSDLDFYAFYKINLFYDNYFQYSKRWWLPGEFYTNSYFKKIGERCAQYGEIVKTAVQVNPYFHINMEQRVDTLADSLVRIFAHGTPDGFEKVLNVIKPALDAGAKTVMVCADDYIPHLGSVRSEYTLFNPIDKAQFTNLADAQNFLLNKLRRWLDSAYGKDIRLEFVPAQYNNFFSDYTRGTAESYFHDLTGHLDPRVVVVWTGNTIRSIAYDMADITRFTDFIQRKPMTWDNTPYARVADRLNGGYPVNYPQKAVLCNLFEPFDIEYPANFSSYLDSVYYSNLGGFGEISKIKYLTFSDFAWNSKDYNPEFSLFKALVRYVGKDNARLLLNFNAAYFQFVAVWGSVRMENYHDAAYECSAEEKKKGAEAMEQMNRAFASLKKMDNQALVEELKVTMQARIDSWNAFVQRLPQTPIR